MRIARSAKELEALKPLRLERMDLSYYPSKGMSLRDQHYQEMKLAGQVGSFSEVRLEPMVSIILGDVLAQEGPDRPELGEAFAPTFHFRYRDTSGTWWDYLMGVWWRLAPSGDGAEQTLMEVPVPDPRQLTLELSATPADRKGAKGQVYIKVTARVGEERLDDLLRNEESVPVRLVVRDSRTRTVCSAVSALPKLKYEPGEGTYSVQVPKGRYTITAGIGSTPFGEAVAASQQVVME